MNKDGAGFEPDNAIACAPATLPIGNNRPTKVYERLRYGAIDKTEYNAI